MMQMMIQDAHGYLLFIIGITFGIMLEQATPGLTFKDVMKGYFWALVFFLGYHLVGELLLRTTR
jgi:hypothetical protein